MLYQKITYLSAAKNKFSTDTESNMAKVRIKSDKIVPYGGVFSIMECFDALLSETIDSTLGLWTTRNGYSYSEISRSFMCAYLCGDSCAEDISNLTIFFAA